ncbi:MAG: right-handed parallel beta-helix repeat-containing protein [Ignavibacteriaceae bacterium]
MRFNSHKLSIIFFIFASLAVTVLSVQLKAQPSGGPYGPIQQNYEIPETDGKIYYVSPDGKAGESGETLENPTTIETAIEKVKTGDVIILRGGIYRTGNLLLNQGITMQPYKDEHPILKGTYVADKWTDLGNGIWKTSWDRLFPSAPQDWWRRDREGKKTPQHRFNDDMVFVNGKFLQSAGWEGEVDDTSYYIDHNSKTVYIGIDPKDKLVEITAFNVGLLRTIKDVHGKTSDKIGPVIRGITFTQYAYRAIEIEGKDPEGLSPESEHGKDVVGTTFEHCTISFCSRVAGYFRGDNFTMRNCLITDTSTEGVYLLSSADALLEKNIFRRNNIEYITGYFPSAVKIFNQTYRVICRDNLVTDLPHSNGIWYDVGNVDGVFINNWVEGVGNIVDDINYKQPWPSQNGFFFEISKNAVCAGNVFVNCDHGIWSLNSSNVHFYNNTFINSMAVIGRNERSAQGDHFGWHPATGPDLQERTGHIFVNNLLAGTEDFKRPLLFVWTRDTLCEFFEEPQLQQFNNNIYVRTPGSPADHIITWSSGKNDDCQKKVKTPEELNKMHPEYESGSKYYSDYNGPLFKSIELGNLQLLPGFKGAGTAAEVPSDVSKLMGNTVNYIGAYPPEE